MAAAEGRKASKRNSKGCNDLFFSLALFPSLLLLLLLLLPLPSPEHERNVMHINLQERAGRRNKPQCTKPSLFVR
jgi:hypothetical protein